LAALSEFTDAIIDSAAKASLQKGELWPDGGQVLYRPPPPKNQIDETEADKFGIHYAVITIPFKTERKEPRRLILKLTTSYDFGNYQVSLDGVKIGEPLRLYSPKTEVKEFPLIDFWPDPGEHDLALECVGKDAASTGYLLGIDSIHLRERRPRVEKFGFDKDKDFKKQQILY